MKFARYLLLSTLLGSSGIQQAFANEFYDINACVMGCNVVATWNGHSGGVDPLDESLIGSSVQVCPCNDNEQVALTLTYTGYDNIVTTEAATSTLGPGNEFYKLTFSYTGTNRLISSGSQVTKSLNIRGAHSSFAPISFHYTPVSSLIYDSNTIPVDETLYDFATSTVGYTVTKTTVLPQSTSTIPCTTSVSTITQSTTVTTTATITPSPKVFRAASLSVQTTRTNCISGVSLIDALKTNDAAAAVSPTRYLEYNENVVRVPWFPQFVGDPDATLFHDVTMLITSTHSTIVLDHVTVLRTTTSTISLPTSTVCSNALASTTITETVTSTKSKLLKWKTTTTTRTITSAITVYDIDGLEPGVEHWRYVECTQELSQVPQCLQL